MLVNSSTAQNFGRPLPLRDVQQQRSRGIRHIDGAFAGELKAHVILGQHDVGNALPVSRLVLSHPKQFGEGEIGKGSVAGELDETIRSEEIRQFLHLRLGALIAPDEGRPNYFIVGIQQNRPVHLPGKADAGDFISAGSRGVESASNRHLAGSPPIVRILFRPPRLRRGERRVLFRA